MSWKEEKLGVLFEITSGGTPSRDNPDFFSGNIPWFKTGDLKSYRLTNSEEFITQEALENSAAKIFPKDTVLLAMYGATIGAAGILSIEAATNQACAAFLPSKHVNPEFLYYFFLHNKQQLINKGVGGAQPNLSGRLLKDLKIPLPPLEVQKKIAAVLEKADALRRKREEQIKRLNDLLQATFLDMFGDPVTNPKGWPEIALEKIADIKSGVTKGRILKGKVISIPYMRVANVQDGKICLDEIKEIQIQANELEKFALQYGDILLTEGGDPDKLGRGAVWLSEIEPCIHQNHIFRVRPDESEVLPEFLSALIGSSRGKRYFFRSAKQTTGIASINMTQLKNFPALVPPLSKQKAFQNFIVRHQTTIKAFSKLEEATTCLFNSLMQRAFKGELELK